MAETVRAVEIQFRFFGLILRDSLIVNKTFAIKVRSLSNPFNLYPCHKNDTVKSCSSRIFMFYICFVYIHNSDSDGKTKKKFPLHMHFNLFVQEVVLFFSRPTLPNSNFSPDLAQLAPKRSKTVVKRFVCLFVCFQKLTAQKIALILWKGNGTKPNDLTDFLRKKLTRR